jgi:hypothetical protein
MIHLSFQFFVGCLLAIVVLGCDDDDDSNEDVRTCMQSICEAYAESQLDADDWLEVKMAFCDEDDYCQYFTGCGETACNEYCISRGANGGACDSLGLGCECQYSR